MPRKRERRGSVDRRGRRDPGGFVEERWRTSIREGARNLPNLDAVFLPPVRLPNRIKRPHLDRPRRDANCYSAPCLRARRNFRRSRLLKSRRDLSGLIARSAPTSYRRFVNIKEPPINRTLLLMHGARDTRRHDSANRIAISLSIATLFCIADAIERYRKPTFFLLSVFASNECVRSTVYLRQYG